MQPTTGSFRLRGARAPSLTWRLDADGRISAHAPQEIGIRRFVSKPRWPPSNIRVQGFGYDPATPANAPGVRGCRKRKMLPRAPKRGAAEFRVVMGSTVNAISGRNPLRGARAESTVHYFLYHAGILYLTCVLLRTSKNPSTLGYQIVKACDQSLDLVETD